MCLAISRIQKNGTYPILLKSRIKSNIEVGFPHLKTFVLLPATYSFIRQMLSEKDIPNANLLWRK